MAVMQMSLVDSNWKQPRNTLTFKNYTCLILSPKIVVFKRRGTCFKEKFKEVYPATHEIFYIHIKVIFGILLNICDEAFL